MRFLACLYSCISDGNVAIKDVSKPANTDLISKCLLECFGQMECGVGGSNFKVDLSLNQFNLILEANDNQTTIHPKWIQRCSGKWGSRVSMQGTYVETQVDLF